MSDDTGTPEKAYSKGCMWGMSGGDRWACPYTQEELITQWLAGWRNGFGAWRKHRRAAPPVGGSSPATASSLTNDH